MLHKLRSLPLQHAWKRGNGDLEIWAFSSFRIYLAEVQEVVQEAAATANVPKERIATHSLRIGGASALLHAGFSVALIQRWGRWASDAFQSYLWESSEDARGVAAKMTSDKTTLTVTR